MGAPRLRAGKVWVPGGARWHRPRRRLLERGALPAGSDFAWHQLPLTLAPDTDYRHAESRLIDAVEEVYREYAAQMAQQHDRMTRAFVAAVGREPRLKLAGSATPMLQAVPAPA